MMFLMFCYLDSTLTCDLLEIYAHDSPPLFVFFYPLTKDTSPTSPRNVHFHVLTFLSSPLMLSFVKLVFEDNF